MYQIKVLNSQEFDEVSKSDPRYVGVDRDNLGFADPQTNTAYVRYTAWPDLNKYLIDHEFEHLLEEEGTDEDGFGIRHKKKKGFAKFLQVFYDPMNIGYLGTKDDSKGLAYIGDKKQPEPVQAQPQPDFSSLFGLANSPISQQSSDKGTSKLPNDYSSGNNLTSSLFNNEGGQQQLSPEMLERLKGFVQGRIPF